MYCLINSLSFLVTILIIVTTRFTRSHLWLITSHPGSRNQIAGAEKARTIRLTMGSPSATSPDMGDIAKALELREALYKARDCTKCFWRGSQPGQKGSTKGCIHCLGPYFPFGRLGPNNLELLETLLSEGGNDFGCFRNFFRVADYKIEQKWEGGALYVRSPGRIPILPTKEPAPEPEPIQGQVAGVKKETKQNKKSRQQPIQRNK